MNKNSQIMEIDDKIKKAESEKGNAVILMVISIFFLWPLLIVGAIMYSNANKEINSLNEEKRRIMFEDYFSENPQQ